MLSPPRHLRQFLPMPLLCCFFCILSIINVVNGSGDLWPLDRPEGMPSIQSLEVMCGKDHMDVHLTFSQPFEGIVSSKGQHGDPRCVYVPPSTGQTFFSFRIAYTRCGTKPDLHGQFYENTVVVQYDKDLLEVWDEAKRLRCEWFDAYEKQASKPPMVIADLDVIQLDFRGDNVDCWMEIQHGKGPWAPPVSGIVPLGSTLTLVVAINDYRGEFDMRVKSCVASDGGIHVIQLSDEFGCVLRPKMISRFLKARGADERASVITYAFFHAFKFPDALSVHIKCKVEICRHGCLDHCQLQPENGDINPDLTHYVRGPLDRKDDKISSEEEEGEERLPDPIEEEDNAFYDDIIHEGEGGASMGNFPPPMKMPLSFQQQNKNNRQPQFSKPDEQVAPDVDSEELDITAVPHKDMFLMSDFPHGPRSLDDKPVAAPRSLSTDDDETMQALHRKEDSSAENSATSQKSDTNSSKSPSIDRLKRKRRSVVISDRKVRSADVGVSGLYEVISEADLAFSPDSRAEAVTVFQGRIREEVVYGICMPVPGFSLLFVLVAVSAVISALVAGSLLYRYQLQKEQLAAQAQSQGTSIPMSLFSNWMGLLRTKSSTVAPVQVAEANGSIDNSIVMSSSINGKTEETSSHVE